MPGELVAFPLTKHGKDGASFVQTVARRMTELPAKTAEKHLASQLRIKAETMARRGFDEATIEREIKAATSAIRAELWRSVLGGVA